MKACFMGLGYIGLPTAIIAAKHGIQITGVDINPHVVESTVVSPYLINAAPFACAATLPISTVSILPAISFWYLLNSLLISKSP